MVVKGNFQHIFWSFLQQFSSQIVTFFVSVILARLLMPEDFGAIALFSVLVSLSNALVDGGLTVSIIRSKHCTAEDYDTVFIFNTLISGCLYILVFFISGIVSDFYEMPELKSIIQVYALVIVVNAFSAVQKTILIRDLKFRKQFNIQLPALIVGSTVGIIVAYEGKGVWSLVFMQLTTATCESILFWISSKWFPKIRFAKEKFIYHFNFGFKIALSNLLNILFANAYTIVVGKFFSRETLGFYNRADTLKQLPVNNISNALNKVSFPLFAKVQDDNIKLKALYGTLMRSVIYVIAPILSFMVVTAEPIIRFLLTDKWLPSAAYLQILCISGLLYPLHSYNLNILQVKGRADLFLKLEVVKKVIIVVVLFISIRYGMIGLVWGQVVISFLSYFVNSYYSGKFLDYHWFKQLSEISGSITLSVLIGTATFFVIMPVLNVQSQFMLIISNLFIIFSSYFLISYIMKFKEIHLILSLLKLKK
ncbi:O-antigen/teichoic acid export membrane protein [Sphingobacterium allocomposti]|uniref:O-antigen/teichoic acid export membrane protein n=1 Tax=Sphingobacterium allocomposti TaxID=415956 RepID=A0A5S5DEX8_9SPHI|nr:lipopolysaccharide biosynthesis protein [Sphingobacterium composti Yoo et al. 2007 non Ten et al. 2007]TYP94613.1 O-antigen/teichoic acid export membrane protein [Sphingobacterium composti Yoo et al. 2007 non Ten et al. 2007]